MARRSTLSALIVACSLLALLQHLSPQGLSFADGDVKGELAKVGQFWRMPHKVTASHGGFDLTSVSQGGEQLHLSLAEAGGCNKPAVFLSRLDGGKLAFGMDYDSTNSRFQLPKELRGKSVRFSAASQESDAEDVDWALDVQGCKGCHVTATGSKDSVMYDASLGLEADVGHRVTARYALDAKRRANAQGALPNFLRSSAGLRMASSAGDLALNVYQPNPDKSGAQVEYEAILAGDLQRAGLKGVPGSPSYIISAAQEGEGPVRYDAKLKMSGPKGLTGGLQAGLRDGKSSFSGYADFQSQRSVAKGLTLGVDAKVTATPSEVDLQPVGVSASADVASLLPSLGLDGTVDLRARYKLGAEKAALSAATSLRSAKLANMKLDAEAAVDDAGSTSGKLRVSGSANGLAARYEGVAEPGRAMRHLGEVVYPISIKSGVANAFGRITQSEQDHAGKPRLQLGVQYDASVNAAGQKLQVRGEGAAYDMGSQLIGLDGKPWENSRLKRARQTAATFRKRIEGSTGEGQQWLRRP